MPRWKWLLTRSGQPYSPHGTIGLYSAFGGMRGAYSSDYVDHTRRESEEPRPGSDGRREEPRR
jgi:hypothetical protein